MSEKQLREQLKTFGSERPNTTFIEFTRVTRPLYSSYDVSILQDAYDVITLELKNSAGAKSAYWIPVKKCDGVRWKVNKKSVSCDSGKAVDMIRFLVDPDNKAYLNATIRKLIFAGNIKPIY